MVPVRLVQRWPSIERLSSLLTPNAVPADWNFFPWASSRQPIELTVWHSRETRPVQPLWQCTVRGPGGMSSAERHEPPDCREYPLAGMRIVPVAVAQMDASADDKGWLEGNPGTRTGTTIHPRSDTMRM